MKDPDQDRRSCGVIRIDSEGAQRCGHRLEYRIMTPDTRFMFVCGCCLEGTLNQMLEAGGDAVAVGKL